MRHALASAALVTAALGSTGILAAPAPYVHNIYLTTSRPEAARRGRWMYDISSPERMNDMFGELARLGVNAMTYHSAYRIDGADYTPRLSELKRATRWPAESRPVEWFLDTCARHGIAGSLAVFIYPTYDHRRGVLATQDMIEVFRGRPGLAGYVPPIEGAPTRGHDPEAFLDLCRWVKAHAPELEIMDYPNGPYPPAIVRLIVKRGGSGVIDVENVQFHGADERLKNFSVSRGMTHLVMGMAGRSRSIVHTHYRYGGSKPWLRRADAYKVRQQAVLTATPHGTSIFSFQHGFWGADGGPDEEEPDPIWRRLVWYEGIIAVQRMLPFLHDARPMADAAVIIPANTNDGGQDLVERFWLPLVKARLCAQLVAYAHQLSPTARVIVCPSLEACDAAQRKQLEAATRAGRVLVLPAVAKPPRVKWKSERVRRILAGLEPTPLDPKDVSDEFLTALGGLDDGGYLRPVKETTSTPFGTGTIIRIPAGEASGDGPLARLAQQHSLPAVVAEGLPDGYMLERWRTPSGTPFLKILATREGLTARNAVLTVPAIRGAAWFIDRERVESLDVSSVGERCRIRLPELNDEYGLVVLAGTREPTLRPAAVRLDGKVGSPVKLVCRIVNTTAKEATGQIETSLPEPWPADMKASAFQLQPGESRTVELSPAIPKDAVRRPHFVWFRLGRQVQRTLVFPIDGRPQVISHKPPPATGTPARPKREPRLLAGEWRGVTAGDARNNEVRGNVPGACFLPRSQEWDAPADHKGKPARYGELIPRLGSPNFLVNNPDPAADVEVRITYCAASAGHVGVYDGRQYVPLGPMPKSEDWATATFRVPKAIVASPEAERPQFPGTNLMFEVHVDGVYVHRIEARKAP